MLIYLYNIQTLFSFLKQIKKIAKEWNLILLLSFLGVWFKLQFQKFSYLFLPLLSNYIINWFFSNLFFIYYNIQQNTQCIFLFLFYDEYDLTISKSNYLKLYHYSISKSNNIIFYINFYIHLLYFSILSATI